jgi:uncharacterized cupredoxin-like copper-binding protein
MKTLCILFALVLSASAVAGETAKPANPHAGMPSANPHAGTGMNSPALPQSGTVLSTSNVPTYTYVEVSQGKKTMWLAALTTPVKKGDTVRFDNGMEMKNFHSKSLKRTFPSIFFVSKLVVDKKKM